MAESRRYVCRNPQKYAGDATRIVARSSWEIMYMQALDNSNLVAKWISEPKTLNISYLDPITKKVKQYWPDFLVQYINGQIELVEVKPLKEALSENAKSTYDKLSLLRNVSKWQAADRFAKSIGGRFRVVTEKDLFVKRTTAPKRSKSTVGTRGTRGTRK